MSFTFGQQNSEFKDVINYYDYQRSMLNTEFKKRFDKEPDVEQKALVRNVFQEFMVKMDSIQNSALINALVKVKIREDLGQIFPNEENKPGTKYNARKSDLTTDAQYPGGFDKMREQISNIFYTDAVLADKKIIRTNLLFVVEKDGSISSVKADGENFTFNRQAEIALYLLPNKFTPAYINSTPVRYRFRLPLAMNFD
ncbi:hypothetical protein [Kaistella solincola]|nr:hypothetical protein [Kaistella solincola]